jgi:hypothetical protein
MSTIPAPDEMAHYSSRRRDEVDPGRHGRRTVSAHVTNLIERMSGSPRATDVAMWDEVGTAVLAQRLSGRFGATGLVPRSLQVRLHDLWSLPRICEVTESLPQVPNRSHSLPKLCGPHAARKTRSGCLCRSEGLQVRITTSKSSACRARAQGSMTRVPASPGPSLLSRARRDLVTRAISRRCCTGAGRTPLPKGTCAGDAS